MTATAAQTSSNPPAKAATPENPGMHTFRVLAADKLAPEGLDFLKSQPDVELVNKPGLSEDEYASLVREVDGMVVRSGVQVTAKMLANPGRLKVIARAGVGVDNIDLDAATAKGILVMNSADASTISTAEHAFALLMALSRNIGPAYKGMCEGKWERGLIGRQLSGRTLGVVGFGRIGRTVAERALAFGMTVVAYDPFINVPTMLDGKVKMFREFTELLPHADVLTFHVPLNDQTKGMLGRETFKLCRDGVMVVNAARGGVVDEDALLEAIESNKCSGAALDVFSKEPPAKDSKLLNHPKILTTPHLGASTKEGQEAVSVAAAAGLLQYLRGQGISGAVNAGGVRVDLDPLQAAYVDLAGRMAELVSPMLTRGIATITFELNGKALAAATGTIERTALVGLLRRHLDTPVNVISVGHIAQQRGIQLRTITTEDDTLGTRLSITVAGPAGAVDDKTLPGDEVRRIVGRVYDDLRPRVVEINGYHMDMIPAGSMVLIQNEDRPGMIGTVGTEFGEAKANIADMTISRRGHTALMLLKLDAEPPAALLNRLPHRPGILKVAAVKLAEERK
jgi:D-3-phosphoglycerate dehydrogenase